jgi:ribosome maturation factor RimP
MIFRTFYGGWPQTAAFFVLDPDHPHHEGLEARLAAIIEPSLEGMGYELVRVAVTGRDRPTVQIMADRADGTPITVEDCEAISRALGAVIDVADPIRGEWLLEVSSPGIDRPLTRRKDWTRYTGHLADDSHARLRLDDGSEVALPLADIRRAKLVLTDALIDATATLTRTN